jgi:hypothetical protein
MSFSQLNPSGYITDRLTSPWREPTLKELLSEPIIMALMDADGVDPEELKAILGWISVQLRSRSNGSDAPRTCIDCSYVDRTKQEA